MFQSLADIASTSSTMDPFSEPLPTDIHFPVDENPGAGSVIDSGRKNVWHCLTSALDKTSGNVNSRKRKISNNNPNACCEVSHRICARRFGLTRTAYKYLEIGINPMKPSKVEIAIGDSHGKEIKLTYPMWKNITDNEHRIVDIFKQTAVRGNPPPSFIVEEHLTLIFDKINDLSVLRMTTNNMRLVMSKSTVFNMINLKFVINSIYEDLNSVVAIVDSKLVRFKTIIANAKDTNVAKTAIVNDPAFDSNNKIDGELYARLFST